MLLYGYWRSGASYRLRIALHLKKIAFRNMPVNLLAGEQKKPAHTARHPLGLVPAIVTEAGDFNQDCPPGISVYSSIAAMDFLEKMQPEPPLFPENPQQRAACMAFCASIAADTQPLGNVSVLRYLEKEMGATKAQTMAFARFWIIRCFDALETIAAKSTTGWLFGEKPGAAEACLIPQLYTARRYGLDLAPYAALRRVEALCHTLTAFTKAHPDNQPDAPLS